MSELQAVHEGLNLSIVKPISCLRCRGTWLVPSLTTAWVSATADYFGRSDWDLGCRFACLLLSDKRLVPYNAIELLIKRLHRFLTLDRRALLILSRGRGSLLADKFLDKTGHLINTGPGACR